MSGLKITLSGGHVVARLNRGIAPATVDAALRRAMNRSVLDVHERVVAKLSGPVLKVDEGFLRGQMQWDVSPDGRVGVIGTNLEYAAIHEFGGVTPPHQIEALDADSAIPLKVAAVSIAGGGAIGTIFRQVVQHPGAVIPERPYLRPSLAEARDSIRGFVVEEIRGLLEVR